MNGKYILDGHKAVPVDDIETWGRWFETADRQVAKDMVGSLRVSTVFLGLDHNFLGGRPLPFETMVFDDKGERPFAGVLDIQERYATWDEAVAGHAEVLARVIAASKNVATVPKSEDPK